ncbi:MAG: CoA ester lyase [Herminiimonas sp.]|nr:CoA ester lyase [Herminiimonas sp.]MDB5856144.1 CoA ester lyase [Herminiimonas sp.]
MQGILRSFLFVPGNRPERFDKACAAGASAVIIDLEDAVPTADKVSARAAVLEWLSAPNAAAARPPVLLRLNAAGSEWFAEDAEELAAHPGLAGVVLPKAEHGSEIEALTSFGSRTVYPLIESAQGFASLSLLARSTGVVRLMFGTIDFIVDMGIRGECEELDYFRSHLVLESRLAGIAPPVDGVTTAISDAPLLETETLRARRFGFGGKLCIHPRQVPVVNASYASTPEEIAWARRVLEGAAAANGAALAVDGKMVDRPVILKAQEIMAQAPASVTATATQGGSAA